MKYVPFPRGEHPMNAETVRELLNGRPFVPLQVRLSSGDVDLVRHPEFAMLLRNTLVIGYPDSDRVAICGLLHIASIERLGTVPSHDGGNGDS
jgi:hypothetical protein